MSNRIASDPTVAAVAARLRRGEPVSVRVWGGSMWPVVLAGARLRFVPCCVSEARVGDVLLVARGGTLTAHRAIRVDEARVQTWGDGLRGPDTPAGPDQLIGRATGVPLARAQLALPDLVARPANAALGQLGRWLTSARRRAAPHLRGLAAPIEAPLLRAARRVLQPFHIEPLTWQWRARFGELSLRAGQRADVRALEGWQAAARGEGAAWIALRKREPLGWMLAAHRDDEVWLRLWIRRSYRGLGVSSRLLDAMLASARARGWERLRVRCDEPRARWFGRRGFRPAAGPSEPSGGVVMEWVAAAR